jgi:hypothetical protein
MDGFELVHVPPGITVDSNLVSPTHTGSAPAMYGVECTTKTAVLRQSPTVYVMLAVPAAPAVTTPEALIDAMPGALLLHTPPAVAQLNALVPPGQADSVPVIGSGDAPTVIVVVLKQPELSIYVIVTVPGAIPVTMPDALIVAIMGSLLPQTPPAAPFDK